MSSKRVLLRQVLTAVKEGDRRPDLLILVEKIKRAPKAVAHGYAHQVRYILG